MSRKAKLKEQQEFLPAKKEAPPEFPNFKLYEFGFADGCLTIRRRSDGAVVVSQIISHKEAVEFVNKYLSL